MRSRCQSPTCDELGSFGERRRGSLRGPWRRAALRKALGDRMAEDREEEMQALPRHLQLRRSRGWRLPAKTLKVDRSTLFGNPFLAADYGSERAVALFRAWITGRCAHVCLPPGAKRALARRRADMLRALPALRGKNLACWCPLPRRGEPDTCHAAVLLALANLGVATQCGRPRRRA